MRSKKVVVVFVVLAMLIVSMSAAVLPGAAAGEVASATLFLTGSYTTSPSGTEVRVHRITSGWDELTVTWNSFGGAYDGAVAASFEPAVGVIAVDVTSLVQAWMFGTPNYGLLLEQDLEGYTSYWSNNSDYGPTLLICYSNGDPCEEFTAVADTYIWQLYPDTNYGTAPLLFTGLMQGYEKQSLIRFEFGTYEGCTPGFWRNHEEDWAATGYAWGDDFDGTFGVDLFDPDITLGEAIWLGGGGVKKLARHGTAGLLSAAHPDVNYPYTVAEVIALVQGGDADLLVEANELLALGFCE